MHSFSLSQGRRLVSCCMVSQGSLRDLISSRMTPSHDDKDEFLFQIDLNQVFSDTLSRICTQQILIGTLHLHEAGFAHRDLKARAPPKLPVLLTRLLPREHALRCYRLIAPLPCFSVATHVALLARSLSPPTC
jgi:hypothetical protein